MTRSISDLKDDVGWSKLTTEEKRKIIYYLTDEDFINERFAIIYLVEIILKCMDNQDDKHSDSRK